jgi:hypothetical protein
MRDTMYRKDFCFVMLNYSQADDENHMYSTRCRLRTSLFLRRDKKFSSVLMSQCYRDDIVIDRNHVSKICDT